MSLSLQDSRENDPGALVDVFPRVVQDSKISAAVHAITHCLTPREWGRWGLDGLQRVVGSFTLQYPSVDVGPVLESLVQYNEKEFIYSSDQFDVERQVQAVAWREDTASQAMRQRLSDCLYALETRRVGEVHRWITLAHRMQNFWEGFEQEKEEEKRQLERLRQILRETYATALANSAEAHYPMLQGSWPEVVEATLIREQTRLFLAQIYQKAALAKKTTFQEEVLEVAMAKMPMVVEAQRWMRAARVVTSCTPWACCVYHRYHSLYIYDFLSTCGEF